MGKSIGISDLVCAPLKSSSKSPFKSPSQLNDIYHDAANSYDTATSMIFFTFNTKSLNTAMISEPIRIQQSLHKCQSQLLKMIILERLLSETTSGRYRTVVPSKSPLNIHGLKSYSNGLKSLKVETISSSTGSS